MNAFTLTITRFCIFRLQRLSGRDHDNKNLLTQMLKRKFSNWLGEEYLYTGNTFVFLSCEFCDLATTCNISTTDSHALKTTMVFCRLTAQLTLSKWN